MASGFFALLDDVATLMEDVAILSKVATKKTASLLSDDLAVNAEKAMGFVSARELPVIWAITKGSFINKLIILPIALILSALYPPAIKFILLLGGLYLAYEGAHKVALAFFPHDKTHKTAHLENPTPEKVVDFEKEKIKSAIRTDFILSIEIIIIAIGTVSDADLIKKILVVSFIALLATVGVYGIVALIVRMDDFGYKLIKVNSGKNGFLTSIGKALVNALPWVIKILTVIGTIALFLVAGGIYTHNIDFFHHLWESWPTMLRDLVIGIVVGFIVYFIKVIVKSVYKAVSKK